MNVELELAYLGVEVADPLRSARSSPTSSASSPATPRPTAPRPGATTTAPSGSSCRRGRPTTPSSSASRPCQPALDRAVDRARDGRDGDRRHRRRPRRPPGRTARAHRGAVGRARRDRARPRRRGRCVRLSPRPGRIPHEGPGVRSRGVPHHRPRRRRPLRPRGDRPRAVGLDGDRPRRYPPDGPLLPLQPRHHSLALGSLPIELPQKLHHVMLETVSQDNVGLAFDRAFKAGLADRQRARQARQRQDVQLLRRHAGRLPARVRPRRADDRRAVDREPSLRPDQRVGPPAAPVAAPRGEGESPDELEADARRRAEQAPQATFDRDDPPILGANPFVGLTREQVVASLARLGQRIAVEPGAAAATAVGAVAELLRVAVGRSDVAPAAATVASPARCGRTRCSVASCRRTSSRAARRTG